MADANVPEANESSIEAGAGVSPAHAQKAEAPLENEAVDAGVSPADIAVEAVASVPDAPAPKSVAVSLPPKAVGAIKSKASRSKAASSAKVAKVDAAPPKPVKAAKAARSAKPQPVRKPAASNDSSISQLKDKIMATSKNADFAKGFQDAIADAQGKAKAAFEKSTASLGEVSEFAKGNVEALVESGKIFAAGAQSLGSTYVTESRAAFETLTSDVKELASAKNPTDFFKLQGDLARRNFETAVATGSKNSEALLKLVNEAFAPISGRVSLAVDKIKQAA